MSLAEPASPSHLHQQAAQQHVPWTVPSKSGPFEAAPDRLAPLQLRPIGTPSSSLPSPDSSHRARAAARSLNALLLGSKEPPPSPSGRRRSIVDSPSDQSPAGSPFGRPLPDLRPQLHTFRPGDAPPDPNDPAAIRAAAAELADRGMIDSAAAASPSAASLYSPAARSAPTQEPQTEPQNVLALKLTVVAGPSQDASYITGKDTRQVVVGRLPTNSLALNDGEVSGTHLILRFVESDDSSNCCWQVADAGSLNGTLLNGARISIPNRKRGPAYRLNSDDLLQLGTMTAIKVAYLPRELLEQQPPKMMKLRALSGVQAPPPPIHRTPSRDGIHRAPVPSNLKAPAQVSCAIELPELRVSGYALSRMGREHERRSQTCEDVVRWVPDLLLGATGLPPTAPVSLSRASMSASGRARAADRALLRTTTCEASPALQQFLALYGGGGGTGSPLFGSPSAQTEKSWPQWDVPTSNSRQPATEPASSARPSLDDGAVFGVSPTIMEDDSSFQGGMEQPLAALFCVFDGHCGRLAAEQAAQLLPRELAERIDVRQLLQRHPPNASVWEQAFAATDQGLECEDGCTATAALLWMDDANVLCLQTANVGDSNGIYVTLPEHGSPEVVQLTSEHRWTSPEERVRLASMGIQLEGRTRLYGLNLSRCLGDKFLKEEDLGLSCQPSMSACLHRPPNSPPALLILASDGLWDVASPKMVADVAVRAVGEGAQAAAEALLQLAHSQRSRDDISIILLHLHP